MQANAPMASVTAQGRLRLAVEFLGAEGGVVVLDRDSGLRANN
jgi:hypothetical protein